MPVSGLCCFLAAGHTCLLLSGQRDLSGGGERIDVPVRECAALVFLMGSGCQIVDPGEIQELSSS